MKKMLFFVAAFLVCASASMAQKVAYVDMGKVLEVHKPYTEAMKTLEGLNKSYSDAVEAKFAEIERVFERYQNDKPYLNSASRNKRENEIITLEKEATKYQSSIFGQDGVMDKKRKELMDPIMEKVNAKIVEFAKAKGYDVVEDITSKATILYLNPEFDKTEDLVKFMK